MGSPHIFIFSYQLNLYDELTDTVMVFSIFYVKMESNREVFI